MTYSFQLQDSVKSKQALQKGTGSGLLMGSGKHATGKWQTKTLVYRVSYIKEHTSYC